MSRSPPPPRRASLCAGSSLAAASSLPWPIVPRRSCFTTARRDSWRRCLVLSPLAAAARTHPGKWCTLLTEAPAPFTEAAPTCIRGPQSWVGCRDMFGAPRLVRSRSPLLRFRIRINMTSIAFATTLPALTTALLGRTAGQSTGSLPAGLVRVEEHVQRPFQSQRLCRPCRSR